MSWRLLTVVAILATTVAAAQQPFDLDPTFRTTIQQQSIGDILERPDGKIIISGSMGWSTMTTRSGLLLNTDGTVVSNAGQESTWYLYMGGKMVRWGEDKFYVGNGQGIRRYWMDGTWDTTFRDFNRPLYDVMQGGDFHVFPDGRVLMTGNHALNDTLRGFVGWQYGLVWLNSDGSLDTTRIHRRISPWGSIWRINELSDGRFICAGGGGVFEGDSISDFVFRIHPDGSLDTTFHAPWIDYGEVDSFLEQPSGKVIICGNFHIAGMPDTLGLIRLLPNGLLDPSFHNHAAYRSTYHHLAIPLVRQIQPIGDEMMSVTGDFDQIDGEMRGGIAMLDTAGNVLPGYFVGSGCGAYQYGDSTIWQYPQKFIVGIKPAQDGGFFIYGGYHGYDDGTTNDPSQRLMSKLYGFNVGIHEQYNGLVGPLQIAPNPSSGMVQFSVHTAPMNESLTIHDPSGRMVLQVPWPGGAYTQTLQAGVLAPGTYIVRVASSGSAPASTSTLYTGKLIILP